MLRGSPRVDEDEHVVRPDAKNDEDGQHVKNAEVAVLADEAVDEIGDEEAAEDAEDAEARDEERSCHQQHEEEYEAERTSGQQHVENYLKQFEGKNLSTDFLAVDINIGENPQLKSGVKM